MQLVDFIQTRLSFAGFPGGELQLALGEVANGYRWQNVFLLRAQAWRKLAMDACREENQVTAAQLWRWAACAYHAASFSFHLHSEAGAWRAQMSRLRELARGCYIRSLSLTSTDPLPMQLKNGSCLLRGYLRKPDKMLAGAVVLVNGLDSIAEVELHAFGNWMLERGLAVLAVDLPAGMRSWPRRSTPSVVHVTQLAGMLADWVGRYIGDCAIGAFGVSFGGNIVARLLAGDRRFVAGVAVCPPAFWGVRELSLERLRKMLAWSFDLNDSQVEETASSITLSNVAAPLGRILLCQMEQDELFGSEHTSMFQAWGGSMVEVRKFPGEHVGTSKAHLWLPTVCDWLKKTLIAKGTA